MTDYQSWRAVNRAMCPEPGPRDLFLVVLINGKRAAIKHAADYEEWRIVSEKVAAQANFNIKLLPMSGSEMMNFLGIVPDLSKPIAELDPEFREQAVKNCKDVLRNSNDEGARAEALELLGHLGVLQ